MTSVTTQSGQIDLRFKLLTGRIETIQISQVNLKTANMCCSFLRCYCTCILQAATILDAKRQLHSKLSDAPPYRQKFFLSETILEDCRTLSSYLEIDSKTIIGVVIQLPWKIYVQDPTSKIYEVEVPSSEPHVSSNDE
jgi:hypothetical protein